jgi:hypothetical protein
MATVPVIAEVPGPVKVKIPFAATVIKAGDRYLIQVPARPGQIYCLEVPDGSGGITFAGVPGSAVYAQSDRVGWPLELTGTVVGAKEDGNSAGASAGASPPAAGGTVLLPLTIEVSESLGTHVRLLVGGASPWVAVAEVAFPRVTFEGFADLPTATGVRCTALSTRVVTAPIGATEPGKAALTLEQQQEFDAILAGLPQLIAAATLPPGATPALGTGGTSPLAASRYFRVAMYVVDSNGNGFADADELAGGMKPFARPGEPGYVNATDAGGNGGSGISPIWDRDEDFSPDFEEIAAGTSLSEKRYAPVVLTCQTFDRRADFDSAGSWRELEQRVVGWERHWDGFNEEMLSWSPPSLLVRTTPRTLSGFMSDFADGWENPDPESGKGLPPRSLFEEYFMQPALIARRVRPVGGVAGNSSATSGYIRAIGDRYRLRGPLSSEDQHRQFLKVTWTQTSGFDENQWVEYAAWSLMGQPLLEQAPTSVEVVTLTIPRGSLYSAPHDVVPQYSVPNGPANPEMLHSQVGEYLKVVRLLPVEFKNVRDVANAGDDVDITPKQNATDTNINSVAWIDNHSSGTDDAPRMPQLRLSMPGLSSAMRIKAKLEVDYTRPYAGHQSEDRVRVPSDGNFREVTGSAWDIYNDADWTTAVGQGFFGGDATLTYQLTKADGTVVMQNRTILFRIAGQNPEDARCKDYIVSQSGTAWFAYALAKHESNLYGGDATYYPFTPVSRNNAKYNQFRALGGGQSGTRIAGREGIPLVERAEAAGPGGIGMFQVTGSATDQTHIIPRAQLWNWQANVNGALAIIQHPIKSGLATRYFNDLQNDPAPYPAAFQEDPPPNLRFGNTDFSSSDAIWITAYNGWGSAISPYPVRARFRFSPSLPLGVTIAPAAQTKRWFWNAPLNPDEFYIRKVERQLDVDPNTD